MESIWSQLCADKRTGTVKERDKDGRGGNRRRHGRNLDGI